MRESLRRLRGILGLSTLGAVVGGLFGAALDAVVGMLQGGTPYIGTMMVMGTVFGLLGAVSAGGFAVMLTLTRRGASVSDLSAVHAGLLGTAIGSLFPYAVELAMGSLTVGRLTALLPIAALCAALGGGLTTTIVLAAKRSAAAELGSTSRAALPPDDDER